MRLVDCEVHRAGHLQASSSSVRQGAASMQGVFKPERLRMLNERHWQQALAASLRSVYSLHSVSWHAVR